MQARAHRHREHEVDEADEGEHLDRPERALMQNSASYIRSAAPMVATSADVLKIDTNRFPSGGRTTQNACGSTTCRIVPM